ncbi:MAG: hypothetical protein RL259_578 [Bacteroidota bacterium]|jgi:hypothetical protein
MNYKDLYTGGETPMSLEEFTRLDDSTRAGLFSAINAITEGNNAILYGCTPSIDGGGNITVTAGYVLVNNEILEVEAQTVADGLSTGIWEYQKQTSYDALGTKTFVNGIIRQTWRKERGILVNVAVVNTLSAYGYRLGLVTTIRDTIAENDVTPTAITLVNNFTGGLFYQRRDNIVTLFFEAVTRNDANTLMATLPAELRPNRQIYIKLAAGTGSYFTVQTNGEVRCQAETFTNATATLTYIVD